MSKWSLTAVLLAAGLSFTATVGAAPQPKELTAGGQTIPYLQIVPEDEPATRYRRLVVLLPPGEGKKAMANQAAQLLGSLLAERYYHVVIPYAAKNRSVMTRKAEGYFGPLLDHVEKELQIPRRHTVLAGISTGGTEAFVVASHLRSRFQGMFVVPGALTTTKINLQAFRGFPVFIRVGGKDSAAWKQSAALTAQNMKRLGAKVDFAELSGQGHLLKQPMDDITKWLNGIIR